MKYLYNPCNSKIHTKLCSITELTKELKIRDCMKEDE